MSKAINCIIVDDEPTAREILELYTQKTNNINLISSCKNVKEAITVLAKNKVDIIFLDINMPEISGISFAKIIDKEIKIIFTTAYREYAIEGFELQAIDFLLKPFSYDRFIQALRKHERLLIIKNSIQLNEKFEVRNSSFIFIRSERKMIKIDLSEIVLIESLSDYIKIHLAEKILITRETISSMEARLPVSKFIRTHRSFIVSIDKIQSYTNEHIGIHKREIPLSRTYKDIVISKLNKY
jgi:DNA-binding LytR/AlgR family response regulator